MTEEDIRGVFRQHHAPFPLGGPSIGAIQTCIAQGNNELRNALEACVEVMQILPTLNGFYGLSVLEHSRGLLELLPITDDVTESMARAGAEALSEYNDSGTMTNLGGIVHEVYSAMRKIAPRKPVDMVLHCPNCGVQHIDKPEANTGQYAGMDGTCVWTNPPHRSHLCGHCGWQWRPSDTPTNGVAGLQTAGEADSIGNPRQAAQAEYWRYSQRPGYFVLPPSEPGDLWAVGVGSTKADNCHFGPTLEAALDEALLVEVLDGL